MPTLTKWGNWGTEVLSNSFAFTWQYRVDIGFSPVPSHRSSLLRKRLVQPSTAGRSLVESKAQEQGVVMEVRYTCRRCLCVLPGGFWHMWLYIGCFRRALQEVDAAGSVLSIFQESQWPRLQGKSPRRYDQNRLGIHEDWIYLHPVREICWASFLPGASRRLTGTTVCN